MKIGRYEILDEIGRGAMGAVYRALDPLIEREVAIKTVPIDQLRSEGPDAEARFLREAQSAGRLSHPNIVTIYDVGEASTLAYIAMEYLPGSTLRALMDRGPLPIELALDTALQMAEALAFAHEHGVVHRDIKPANVVVTGQHGRIKLADFGIAHLANSDQTQTGLMLGSPRYMSPEQAMGRELEGRSDIFSLGAVLYEMLTGRYAFDGDSLPAIVFRVIHESPPPAPPLRGALPPGLPELLARMLHKDPAQRPDARTLAEALKALVALHPAPQAVSAPTPVPPGRRFSNGLRMLAFSAPLGIFLLIGLGIIVIQHFLPAPRETAALPNLRQPSDPVPTDPVPGALPPPPAATRPIPEPASTPRPVRKAPRAPIQADAYLRKLDDKAVELRVTRTELLLQYTEQHPDVVQVDRQLEQLRDERRQHVRLLRKQQAR